MINSYFKLHYQGKIFDKIASGDIDLEEVGARVEFPAPYAHYAFTTHGRDIYSSAFRRYEGKIHDDFIAKYLETFSVRQAAHYAARQLLASMRRYELNAPGPRPPKKNPHRDRLRRVTGRLSDSATIPRLRQQKAVRRLETRQRLTLGRKAKLARRVTRTDRPSRVKIGSSFSRRERYIPD